MVFYEKYCFVDDSAKQVINDYFMPDLPSSDMQGLIADVTKENQDECIRAGMDHSVSKSVNIKLFFDALERNVQELVT